MTVALATLRNARADAERHLAAARTSHRYLVESCNRKIEESAASVNLLTLNLNEYDTAIEKLEGAE